MSLEKSILGMGNPLLDISAEVDEAFLAKYEVRLIGSLDFNCPSELLIVFFFFAQPSRAFRSASKASFFFLSLREQSVASNLA